MHMYIAMFVFYLLIFFYYLQKLIIVTFTGHVLDQKHNSNKKSDTKIKNWFGFILCKFLLHQS